MSHLVIHDFRMNSSKVKVEQSEYLIVVDTASLLQAPPSDQIFLELEFDVKLSNNKLERFIKEKVVYCEKVTLESIYRSS